MSTEYQTLKIVKGPGKGDPQPISATTDQFGNSILNAAAALNGWELRFSSDKHRFRRGFVRILDTEVVDNNRKVKVTVEIGLNNSNNYDSNYEGEADILVMAEVASN